ncbi:MAG: ferrous iron transporter B [Flavobacteriales bacterium]
MTPSLRRVALIGNPNAGKSSLFNELTGMRQQIGNFPGVTVEKHAGQMTAKDGRTIEVIDLPGTYSLHATSEDERVVVDLLTQSDADQYPQLFLYVADASNLERNLLFFSQLRDAQLPMILVITMEDVVIKHHGKLNLDGLRAALEIPVLSVNARTGDGVEALRNQIESIQPALDVLSTKQRISSAIDETQDIQLDSARRFSMIDEWLGSPMVEAKKSIRKETLKLDRLLLHRFWGYFIFGFILLLIFQFIYRLASYPMDFLDESFNNLSVWTANQLPERILSSLLAEGFIPGLGGVLVFVPQIAILFFFLAMLEETGYMARVVFLMDRLVKPFGLSGRSVVPLMSSVACAIPGIMAARSISSPKRRLTTILVAPLMSCSARIPVYTMIISLVIPDRMVLGVFNIQGLVLFALYLLGLISALLVSWILQKLLKSSERDFLMMELPSYKWPRWKHVGLKMWEKVRIFAWDAGRIILAISIVLWALASFSPEDGIDASAQGISEQVRAGGGSEQQAEAMAAAYKMEHSYIGHFGKAIEPAIQPLGYDWKMGIALISSFAAREVFVGTMATIYSVGADFEDSGTLKNRLKEERNPATGALVYNLASGCSLLVFYVYAMQCMATFAVMRRETQSWKWPVVQMVYMGVLAYVFAWIVFQWLT